MGALVLELIRGVINLPVITADVGAGLLTKVVVQLHIRC